MAITPIRIGMIQYLNTIPFRHQVWPQPFEMSTMVPAQLAPKIVEGMFDAGPVSLMEFERYQEDLAWLDPFGIAVPREARSVLLITKQDPLSLDGATIQLTSESRTSVVLVRVVLEQLYGLSDLRYAVRDSDEVMPRVVIGDRALAAKHQLDPDLIYDLAELWHEQTGLPFVFALWACRKSWPVSQQMNVVRQIEFNLRSFDPSLSFRGATKQLPEGMSATDLRNYLANFVYILGDRERLAANEFLNLASQLSAPHSSAENG